MANKHKNSQPHKAYQKNVTLLNKTFPENFFKALFNTNLPNNTFYSEFLCSLLKQNLSGGELYFIISNSPPILSETQSPLGFQFHHPMSWSQISSGYSIFVSHLTWTNSSIWYINKIELITPSLQHPLYLTSKITESPDLLSTRKAALSFLFS